MEYIGNIAFGKLLNVRKSGDEDGVYFVDIEIQIAEGFPMEVCLYCARHDDHAITGKWVYQQIIDGNFDGEVTMLTPFANPVTGMAPANQPISQGAQTL